ncbi:L-rhamnose mutarotase [Agromyces sp. CF514]|uniref:L-rhamnose mutarotase n=1 Tax=Agromyces sp. CF514 TaxID=1881031 RepID=UPI0008F2D085|nr:L-rhamnose mutarotase [Agromyces sp. CF514]SFR68571.1 L-rhamnose mutarotase [Agromyces sp. CF514]
MSHDAAAPPLTRVCFQLQVKPERMAEYRERHAAVWPDMLRALKRTGWNNYSLFLRDDGLLIGYVETPSIHDAQAAMAETEVNARWQAEMGEFFVDLDVPPDEGFVRLTEVFHLEDQLAALDAAPAASVTQTTTDHAASVAPTAESSNS